ncbi:MAG: DNA-formamidopyrimidine glycosylase [Peptococcaceae bacterium]|nr:DNA-formamidopyrimidine glycosylase [Peptococcaceae bacterium]
MAIYWPAAVTISSDVAAAFNDLAEAAPTDVDPADDLIVADPADDLIVADPVDAGPTDDPAVTDPVDVGPTDDPAVADPALVDTNPTDAGILLSKALLTGRFVINITRRGKYLLLDLSKGLTLVIHLRMTGQLIFHAGPRDGAEITKHTHVVFYFTDGEMHFNDTRKFGRIQIVKTLDVPQLLEKLGPEPLDENFEFDVLGLRLADRHKTASIKAALLDQEVVAGLGNIYADEVLFAAGVRPSRPVKDLKASEIILIHQAMREILAESIASQGTTFRDFRDAYGKAGKYKKSLKVYGRNGKACIVCKTKLTSEKIAGRSSCYCPKCQE